MPSEKVTQEDRAAAQDLPKASTPPPRPGAASQTQVADMINGQTFGDPANDPPWLRAAGPASNEAQDVAAGVDGTGVTQAPQTVVDAAPSSSSQPTSAADDEVAEPEEQAPETVVDACAPAPAARPGKHSEEKPLKDLLEAMVSRCVDARFQRAEAEREEQALLAAPAAGESRGDRGPSYDVGYGKPPEATRFKKGESGNPAGRGKGRPSTWAMFESEFQRLLTVRTSGGERIQITTAEALVRAIVQEALKGNWRAWDRLKDYLDAPHPDSFET